VALLDRKVSNTGDVGYCQLLWMKKLSVAFERPFSRGCQDTTSFEIVRC